jgi:pimeloyl-ACP methyl ester carboxylesterase
VKRKRGYLAEIAFVGGLILLALAFRFWSVITFSLALAVPSLELRLAGLGREAARQEVTLPANGKTIRADLYRPANPGSALLLVHGLSPAGRRHPELMRLARLLSRHGVLVLVPEFEGFVAFRLSGGEVEEISSALRYLSRLHDRVGIAGFSFGAGPALLAAARHPNLRLVGSFGGYADLRHVIAYITTGIHEFRGVRYSQRQEEYNRWKLLALLVGFVEGERDRGLLQAIAERKLANPAESTDSLERQLGDEGRNVLALVLNRREEAMGQLLARLPSGALQAMDRLSPLPAVSRLPGRLLLAHGAGDDSIPFTESLRLAERAGGRALAVILHTFHHTGPQRFWGSLGQRATDGWKLIRLADELLAAE